MRYKVRDDGELELVDAADFDYVVELNRALQKKIAELEAELQYKAEGEYEMTQDEICLDAKRYQRLRILGCAPMESKELKKGLVLRFTNLDDFLDNDLKNYPSRGEAK